MFGREKVLNQLKKDTDVIIDDISKLPYSRQVTQIQKSINKLEESKIVLSKQS